MSVLRDHLIIVGHVSIFTSAVGLFVSFSNYIKEASNVCVTSPYLRLIIQVTPR